MKRFFLGVAAIIGLVGYFCVPVGASNLNNFTIKNYDIKYELKRNSDRRSTLKTIETITAVFPAYDQNHGIERAIPSTYKGRSTKLSIQSVETIEGRPYKHTTYEDNGNTVVRIGDASQYVHSEQTYVLTYTQQDVTYQFANTNADEFYWDTNGTDWKVPIDTLSVSLAVDETLMGGLTGKTACYSGGYSQANSCKLEQAANIFTAQAANLEAGENITIALGFKPATFAPYQPTLIERLAAIWKISLVVFGAIATGVIVWIGTRWYKWSSRRADIGTIVPEYLPSSEISLTALASISTVKPKGSVFTAQLIDFAVRGYVKIYETKKKSLFKSADYKVEITKDISELASEEQEILRDIFQGNTTVGATLMLSSLRSNSAVYSSMQDNDRLLTQLVRGAYTLRERDARKSAWFMKIGWILLAAAIVLLNPVMLVAAVVSFALGYTLWPLTDKGVQFARYAEGMNMYIHVAEAERLRVLQSPEGAQKIGVDVTDSAQLVKLYEKMLPYAILFGEEKEWSKRIGELYDASQATPSWYSGQTVFNAAMFASSINTFSTTAGYSAPYESSSGGSSGGGFSGGGGGGGGGGGW